MSQLLPNSEAQRRLLPRFTSSLSARDAAQVRLLADSRVKEFSRAALDALDTPEVANAYAALVAGALAEQRADPDLSDYFLEIIRQHAALRRLRDRDPHALLAYLAVAQRFDVLGASLKERIGEVDPAAKKLFEGELLSELAHKLVRALKPCTALFDDDLDKAMLPFCRVHSEGSDDE